MLVNHLERNLVRVWAKQLADCFPGWPCRSPIQSHGEVGNWGLSHLRILTRVERRRCSRNPQKALCFKQVQFQCLRKRQNIFSAYLSETWMIGLWSKHSLSLSRSTTDGWGVDSRDTDLLYRPAKNIETILVPANQALYFSDHEDHFWKRKKAKYSSVPLS